jgi:heme-degrading monooxygenase HmoA
MHAVVVKVTIDDFEPAREFLTSQIVPRVSQAPGFVAGYWTRSGQDQGQSMIVFESEDAAQAVKQMIESGDGPGEAVTLDSAEVCEVVANA